MVEQGVKKATDYNRYRVDYIIARKHEGRYMVVMFMHVDVTQ